MPREGFGGAHPHAPVEGRTDEWWTPPEVFEAIGLRFDLDPCAPPWPKAEWIPTARRITREEDGLSLPWTGRCWMNPPYGRETGAWMRKLAEHGEGIGLVFARTDTSWWHAAVPKASAICFIRGRLTFIAGAGQSAPGNSGGPSALIAYGDDCAQAIANSGLGMTYFTPPDFERGGRSGVTKPQILDSSGAALAVGSRVVQAHSDSYVGQVARLAWNAGQGWKVHVDWGDWGFAFSASYCVMPGTDPNTYRCPDLALIPDATSDSPSNPTTEAAPAVSERSSA